MSSEHRYTVNVKWTGNMGSGTDNYRNYERSHDIIIEGKDVISGSSDPAFRGDRSRHNPEDLLVSSVSTCHMLWYLHVCAVAGVIVTGYTDLAEGIMVETADGGGRFTGITLHPVVTVKDESMISKANELHARANSLCFIANSLNFPVHHMAETRVDQNH